MAFVYKSESGKDYLIIQKDADQKIDTVTLGMLENNEIDGVLPLYVLRNNLEIECRYDLAGLYSFNEIDNSNVTKGRLTSFLNAILDICSICDDYLIDCSQIVLDPEYIYTDERGISYKFVIAPFADLHNTFFEKLKEYILAFTYNYNEDCTYIERLKDQLRRTSSFSVEILKGVLKESGLYKEKEEPVNRREIRQIQNSKIKLEPKIPVSEVPVSEQPEDSIDDEIDEDTPKRGLFGFGKKKKGQVERGKDFGFGDVAIPGAEDGGYSKGSIEIPKGDVKLKSQNVGIKEYVASKQNFGHTQFGSAKDYEGTIENHQGNASVSYSLVRLSTGEQFTISTKTMKVGRKKSIVDICIPGNLYVGRLHAALFVENGRLYVDDNNSENGTYINSYDNAITGRHVVNRGDQIIFGDEVFEVQ